MDIRQLILRIRLYVFIPHSRGHQTTVTSCLLMEQKRTPWMFHKALAEYIMLYNQLTTLLALMVSMLVSSAVDHRLHTLGGSKQDYKIGICYFSAEHAALMSKRKSGSG